MAAEINTPGLCCLHTMKSLRLNPATPTNLVTNTNFVDRLMMDDFLGAWEEVPASQAAGKAKPSLPSVNPGQNEVRKFYKYEVPVCDTVIHDPMDICSVDATAVEEDGYIYTDIDNSPSVSWKTNLEDFDKICKSPNEVRANFMRKKAKALKEELNKRAIEQVYAAMSDYHNGDDAFTAVHSLPLLTDDAKVNYVGLSLINEEYRAHKFSGVKVIFGGNGIARFNDVNAYQMNSDGTLGVKGQTLASLPFVYDSQFDEVYQALAGDQKLHAVTVPVGSFLISMWNKYTGAKRIVNRPDYAFTTIEIDGLLYDYSLNFKHCADPYWQEQLTLNFGFAPLPDKMYCESKGLIKHWLIECGSPSCV